jgi:hypothetical protein
MHDSVDIAQGATWLLLIHQIPPKPDYFRVKVRRRLHRLGAVALKNSVYVLPNTDDAMEDFQWLRRAVVDEGGEATLCTATFIEGVDDGEVEAMFREQADAEYEEIVDSARVAAVRPSEADVRRLTRQLAQAKERDYFQALGAAAADRAVRELETAKHTPSRGGDGEAPLGATWVTRRGVFVDRIASGWLIRRFIDSQARFKFVAPEGYEPAAGELRFDMFDGEYTHEGEDCTFEVLAARFEVNDAAVRAIADIVHDIDCKDEKFAREETVGVASMIRGIAAAHADDATRMEAGAGIFDGLYAAFARPE